MCPPVEAGLADRIGATFALMADEFVKAFEPLQGMVVAVEGDTVYIDLGEQSGVLAGQEFVVFRRGEAFHHPITGKQLGYYESILGHAHVRRVQAEFAEAAFVARGDQPSPRPEDGVRISRGRIKVAVTAVLDLDGWHGRCAPGSLPLRERARAEQTIPGGGPLRGDGHVRERRGAGGGGPGAAGPGHPDRQEPGG